MREILFRGKDEGTKKWVQGYYLKGATRHCITCSLAYYPRYDVIPETVGQYTGLTDKNGKKIFEGDIVKHLRTLWGVDNSDIGTIQWCQKTCKFYRTSKFDTVHIVEIWKDTAQEYEIIGNIHDNPELLND